MPTKKKTTKRSQPRTARRATNKTAKRVSARTTKKKKTTTRTASRATKKSVGRGTNRMVAKNAFIMHHINVGERLVWNVEGHAARTDSPEFRHARATLHKILATFNPNPYGTGPVESHHGGSLWVHTGEAHNPWRLFLNWAGIEWAAQFCCDPAQVERLRQNALAITNAFPATLRELAKLGYNDAKILTSQITTPADVGRYVDSIWNACVPIPQPQHTGTLKPAAPLASGVHNYPEPACGIPRVMRSDFVPFIVDKTSGAAAIVAPVAPHGSGDGRLRVIHAERGHPLQKLHKQAHDEGNALILDPQHPIAKAAFALQV